MENIKVFYKPKNMTSNDLVQIIKKRFKYKKVGHAGTLDPMATGVMVIGINDGTKLLSKLILDDKVYIATIQFGYSTTTFDLEGEKNNFSSKKIKIDEIKNKVNEFVKQSTLNQKPPIYSAIKINGKKLYEYARQNINIELKPRTVQLFDAKILKFDYDNQILKIELKVSKGFYIRSFANDLALSLNSYGTLIDLVRTKSGQYSIDQAITLDNL